MATDTLLDTVARAWQTWMFAMSWQATLVVAIVLAVSLITRKASPHFRYFLWCLVLIKLCLPPSLTLATGAGQWLPLERPPFLLHQEGVAPGAEGAHPPSPGEPAGLFFTNAASLQETVAVGPRHSTGSSWSTSLARRLRPQALMGGWAVGMLLQGQCDDYGTSLVNILNTPRRDAL